MDLTRPSSGHDQAEDPLKIHHPEEEEHHESRTSRMLGKVKAKAKKLKNRLTKHGIDGNEHDHDVVDEEDDDESDEPESEKHVAPVNEVPNVRGYRTSQPEETNVPAPEEIIPSGTKGSTDFTGIVPEPLGDATYEHEAPSYPVRTSDVSDREESRETHHMPLKTPVSLLSATEDVTTPGEDGLLGGQREVNTDRPKRFEDDLSGESTYQSKFPFHTQQGSGEAGEYDQKSESEIGKNSPKIEPNDDFPVKSHHFDQKIESEIGNDSSTVFGGNPETGPRDDFPAKRHQKIEANDGRQLGTELSQDFPVKSYEFEQTIGSEIGEDNGGGKPGTERREDFLGKSYEFDQEIESAFGKDSPTRLAGDENFPTRSDDMKVTTGLGRVLTTGTDDHFSPEFSGPKDRDDFDWQAEQTRYEAQEPNPTTYTEMNDSEIDTTKSAVALSQGYSGLTAGWEQKSPVVDESVAQKLTTDDEHVKQTASDVTTKLPLSADGNGVEETEQGEDKGVPTRHLEEKLTPEEENKAFSDMVAEKLNLGGGEKTTNEVEVAVEKIPSHTLPEEIEHGEPVEEEGKGGIVGKIKGVYSYWLGGTTEEMKPKSPSSVEESTQSLGSTVGTKELLDSCESRLGETNHNTGAVPVHKEL